MKGMKIMKEKNDAFSTIFFLTLHVLHGKNIPPLVSAKWPRAMVV